MKATVDATLISMLEDARRTLGGARHERRDGEDVRVLDADEWRMVRDAVAAVLAELDSE